ncbi:MAG TPA: RNA methyltransferase, partial [Clostridiales bacterium]|nr:RNA methyltransferase [Clostridiales bacterium]
AKKAGVSKYIEFINDDMRNFTSKRSHGVIITNPPYGERLMTRKQIVSCYKAFGKMFSALPDWSAYVLSSVTDFENLFGKKCKKRKLYNGKLECNLYSFLGKK